MIDKEFVINQLTKCINDKDPKTRLKILVDINKDLPDNSDTSPIIVREVPSKKEPYRDSFPFTPTYLRSPFEPYTFMQSENELHK